LARKAITAVAYMRTSSASNVGADKDSDKRQRAAIEAYAVEKTTLVLKLKAARDRKIAQGIKCGGRKSHAEIASEAVVLAKQLHRKREPIMSLREIAAELAR
jgi:hypothetical protein